MGAFKRKRKVQPKGQLRLKAKAMLLKVKARITKHKIQNSKCREYKSKIESRRKRKHKRNKWLIHLKWLNNAP